MSRPISIVPSVLPADFSRLGDECKALEDAGANRIQFDVMDGVFVPNLTFGPDVISSVRAQVDLPFEAHLMVIEPDGLLDRYIGAGCELVIVHAETCTHLHRTLNQIIDLGATAGLALNPHTPCEVVTHVRSLLGLVLVMTVNPGFGGQDYIPTMESKITQVANILDGYDCDIEVDGGIGPDTVTGATAAGANVLVAGSSIYRDPNGLEHAISNLRALAESAQQ